MFTREILDRHVDIIPDNLSKKELNKISGQNGRVLTPLMTRDATYNWHLRKQLKNALQNGLIHPGDSEELNRWITDNNIQFHKPTIRERLFI